MENNQVNIPELIIKSTETYPIRWYWEIKLNNNTLCKSEHTFENENLCRVNLVVLNTCFKYFKDKNMITL